MTLRDVAEREGLDKLPFVPKPPREVRVRPDSEPVKMDGALPSYDDPLAPPPDIEPQQMQNYEKLSGFERWVTDRLPGFAESGVGQALAKFGNSWLGKALEVINVPVETVERGFGWVAQQQEAMQNDTMDEFKRQSRAAWAAGELSAEVVNAPIIRNGQLTFPDDLPGVGQLAVWRQEIYDRARRGERYQDVVEDIRSRYYDSQGALAIRAQKQDLIFGVVADPLNYILPMLKPVDALHAARASIVSSKFANLDEVSDLAQSAAKALNAAEEAGDATQIALRTAQLRNLEAMGELGPIEQLVIKLTGGLPGDPAGSRLNPFALTREAKAFEYVDTLTNNIQSRIIAQSDDPAEWLNLLKRARDGMATPELGGMLVTPEGRLIKGNLDAIIQELESLNQAYQSTKYQRDLLGIVAGAIDSDPVDVYARLAGDDAQVILRQFASKIDESPEVRQAIESLMAAAGRESVDDLASDIAAIPRIVTDDIYTPQLLQLSAYRRVGDVFGKVAAARYGIESRGFLNKLSAMVKSAETLAFLRTNPGYLVKNFLNNEMTMIARGVYGTWSLDDAAKFWTKLGFEPSRLGVGFGSADLEALVSGMAKGEVGAVGAAIPDAAGEVISAASRGEFGWTERVSNFFNGVNLGPLDMGEMAAKVERHASVRATTAGYLEGWRTFWKPPRLDELDPGLARILPEDVQRAMQKAAQGALNPQDLDNALLGDMSMNVTEIAERATQRIGADLDAIMSPELQEEALTAIVNAAEDGPGAVQDAIAEIRQKAHGHIDSMVDNALDDMRDEAAAMAKTSGPAAYVDLWSNMTDDLYAAMSGHSRNLERLTDAARNADGQLANTLWNTINDSESRHFKRLFDTFEARMEGFASGAKEAGLLEHADDIPRQFKTWRRRVEGFFEYRNRELERFFKARLEGKEFRVGWDDLKAELNDRWTSVSNSEAVYQQRIDRLMGSMLPEDQLPLFKSWRNAVADWRQKDRDLVTAFRRKIDGIDPDRLGGEWTAHWAERQTLWKKIVEEERAGFAALMGDERQAARYGEQTAQWAADKQLISRAVMGEALGETDDEIAQAVERLDEIMTQAMTPEELEQYKRFNREAWLFDQWRKDADELFEQVDAKIAALRDDTDPVMRGESLPITEQIVRANEKGITDLWTWLDAKQKQAMIEVFGGEQAAQDTLRHLLADGALSDEMLRRRWSHLSNLKENVLLRLDADLRGSEYRFVHEGDGLVRMVGPNAKDITFFKPTADRPAILQMRQVWNKGQGTGEKTFAEQLRYLVRQGEDEVLSSFQTEEGAAFWNRMVEKGYVRRVGEVPSDIADRPYVKYQILEVPGVETGAFNGIPDFNAVVGKQQFVGRGLSELWYNRTDDALQIIGDEALETAKTGKPIKIGELSAEQQQAAQTYYQMLKGQMSDARYAATRYALYKRDSALLNYNRRLNYNSWLGTFAPYEFWMTNSMFRWALHSIDRPAMFSTYARMQKFLQTAMRREGGLPQRLQGSVRVKLPFLPKWMGNELFVDPFRSTLPFKQMSYPFEQISMEMERRQQTVESTLRQMLADGQITQDQLRVAMETRSGEVWDRAQARMRLDDDENARTPFDLVSMMAAPHAPITWAYNVARGTPENIQPFLPLSRTVRGVTALLGVQGGYNPEAAIRRTLGLPEFDKWDDYRIDRMLANMAATNEISSEVARRAMIERADATDPDVLAAFNNAERRAGVEFGVGAVSGMLGFPARPYPPGEEHLRELADDYSYAWDRYNRGDSRALTEFYDEHPEYEARLAIYDKPEERLRRFLIDETWSAWNELPSLSKREVTDQLGPEFEQAFLNKETRSYDAITTEQLGVWAQLMGGDPPGTLPKAAPLSLPPADISYRADAFYNTRKRLFPNYWELQGQYFKLAKGDARRNYLDNHPELAGYWNWRNDFLMRNPDVAPYIDEDWEPEYKSEDLLLEAQAEAPNFTLQEWQFVMEPHMFRVMTDLADGAPLNDDARIAVEQLAQRMGMTYDELIDDFLVAAGGQGTQFVE